MVSNSFLDFAAQDNLDEVEFRQEEKAANALVIQKAAAEAAMQEVGSRHVLEDIGDIFTMFSDSE